MTKASNLSGLELATAETCKYVSILLLSAGLGLVSAFYSPLLPLVTTFLFTAGMIALYTNSYYRSTASETLARPVPEEIRRHGVLFYLFSFAFFVSITVPKSGKTIGSIPVTTANMLILLALCLWFIHVLFSHHANITIPVSKPIIAFILYGIGSALLGLIYQNDLKQLVLEFVAFIGFIPIYFLTCSLVRTTKQIQLLLVAVVVSFILVCGYGVLQIRLGFATVAVPGLTEQYGLIQYAQFGGRWNIIEGGYKLYSTFQNGNILGNHLATFIPLLGGILIGMRRFWRKALVSGVFLLACYTLVLTYSRGAAVGTLSGIFVFLVLSKKISVRMVVLVIVLLAVISVLIYQFADRPEMNRFNLRRISENPDQFSAGRLKRAEQVLFGFKEFSLVKKLFGVGFGGTIITPFYWRFQLVDNLYLSFLFKFGLVGLAIFLWALAKLFFKILAYRSDITDTRIRGVINGGIAGLFGSLVHNLADALWFFPPLAANFWFLAGITVCLATIGRRQATLEMNPGFLQKSTNTHQ